ncbi:hypothetical protein IEQ34_005663 [Dendrobium chrysotoxum]|uniref:Uncharacterized protein n=1 Tax=Dendrobium chrysotoxum TaxID=161865 RepID=A0AAV7HDN5_DENCH|nr:hypothetical protein IEQ34_005663 [Dendrobium chrysotoxum]
MDKCDEMRWRRSMGRSDHAIILFKHPQIDPHASWHKETTAGREPMFDLLALPKPEILFVHR